jgi:hypothetical protein
MRKEITIVMEIMVAILPITNRITTRAMDRVRIKDRDKGEVEEEEGRIKDQISSHLLTINSQLRKVRRVYMYTYIYMSCIHMYVYIIHIHNNLIKKQDYLSITISVSQLYKLYIFPLLFFLTAVAPFVRLSGYASSIPLTR